jgi:hypothetical protein
MEITEKPYVKTIKTLDLLGWKPQDRLLYYINKLDKDDNKLRNNSL